MRRPSPTENLELMALRLESEISLQSAAQPQQEIRVLHIVENLDNQAVENWLLRVFRESRTSHPHIKWTFFCTEAKRGKFDIAAQDLGGEVIHTRYALAEKIQFLRGLRRVMKQGNYNILHCHHDIMSAGYLLASKGLPFQKRIVHVHNTSISLPTSNRLKAALLSAPMRWICLHMADQVIGISRDALQSLIGTENPQPSRHQIVHYAIDTARFARARQDRDGFRREMGFDDRALIVLFVGRVVDYKNPLFVVEILERLAKENPRAVAVFAGMGAQEQQLKEAAKQAGLERKVRLLGFRNDVAELMVNSDVLIWPSLEEPKEGLGLGIVEAQAAGLPILMSRSVPREAIVVPALVDVLPLAAGAKAWANRTSEILKRTRPNREQSLTKVESSSFSMGAGVGNLMRLYEGVHR